MRVDSIAPGQWYFAATAMKDGAQSDLSNILPVEIARPPAAMRTVVLQFNASLATTNWQDAGFFRLRLP